MNCVLKEGLKRSFLGEYHYGRLRIEVTGREWTLRCTHSCYCHRLDRKVQQLQKTKPTWEEFATSFTVSINNATKKAIRLPYCGEKSCHVNKDLAPTGSTYLSQGNQIWLFSRARTEQKYLTFPLSELHCYSKCTKLANHSSGTAQERKEHI